MLNKPLFLYAGCSQFSDKCFDQINKLARFVDVASFNLSNPFF